MVRRYNVGESAERHRQQTLARTQHRRQRPRCRRTPDERRLDAARHHAGAIPDAYQVGDCEVARTDQGRGHQAELTHRAIAHLSATRRAMLFKSVTSHLRRSAWWRKVLHRRR